MTAPAGSVHPFLPAHGPNDPVATGPDGVLTAAELVAWSRRLAQATATAPALVCLCSDRIHIAVTLLTALTLDVPCVMPHDHSPAATAFLQRRYRNAPLIAEHRRFSGIDTLAPEGFAPGPDRTAETPAFQGERCAVHVFTSGSTGTPRCHPKSWAALARVGRALGERFGFEAGTTVVATVPGQHVYGLEASLMLPLQNGGVVHRAQPSLPADIDTALAAAASPRVLASTPLQLNKWLNAGVAAPRISHAISATAPLDAALAERVETRLGAPLFEMYGSTETGIVATRRTSRTVDWRPSPDIALGGTDAEPTVCADYLPEPVALGDRIVPNAEGSFRLLGRDADMVKVAGKRGSLADLTARLCAVEGVTDATIFQNEAEPGAAGRLIAFVVAPGMPVAHVRAALRQRVDPAFVPRPIIRVDALPRTETGKLPRTALEDLYREWQRRA